MSDQQSNQKEIFYPYVTDEGFEVLSRDVILVPEHQKEESVFDLYVSAYRVPEVKVYHSLESGYWNLYLNHAGEIFSSEELGKFGWFMAHGFAYFAGFTSHGKFSHPINPFEDTEDRVMSFYAKNYGYEFPDTIGNASNPPPNFNNFEIEGIKALVREEFKDQLELMAEQMIRATNISS